MAGPAAWCEPDPKQPAGTSPVPPRSLDAGGITLPRFEAARRQAAALVARMTLTEKISQFGVNAPAIPRLGLPAFNYYDSEALHGLIHVGPVTVFPMPLALGCTWNRGLMRRVFTAVSDEIWAWHKKSGSSLAMFSPPTVNMGTRDPRWGRIAENYSEDPYLVAQMAVPTIQGMQGNDQRYLKTIACAKHFIANDTEDDRERTSAAVDPRSFWEYYSRGFEACVREGRVFTVMSSYNALNGIPTSASRFLLTELLRERWGFRGYVVSDCDAIGDICRTQHFVPTMPEAAALAVNAGCDINCGLTLQTYLQQAVDAMLIGEAALEASLVRSFTGRVLLGEFDPPEQNPYHRITTSCLESLAHRQLALEAARQAIVLFKNERQALPLDPSRTKKIAVIGPMADVCHLGNYSGTPWHRVTPLEGIRSALGIVLGPSTRKSAADFFRIGSGPGQARPGGFARWYRGPRLESNPEGGQDLYYIVNGSWVAYRDVLLTGTTEFHARVASGAEGGTLEVRLDSRKGPLVAKLNVPYTGGWQRWREISAPVKRTTGVHTIYLRFTGGTNELFRLHSFHLTPESQLPGRSGRAEVTYAMGCTVTGVKDTAHFTQAAHLAREADVALVFVGTDQQVSRENHDRSDIQLPGAQHELVQAVHTANPNTILVISSNAPLAVNWEQEHLPAIVGGIFLGGQQGRALADVLFGNYNPGGKLSTTWYRQVADLPDFHDYNLRHGRTYMYFRGNPLYPFGHGLSYTVFRYRRLRLSGGVLRPGGQVGIALDVTNSGRRSGDEIVQVYIRCAGKVERPLQQLVNFERVSLKAGQTKTVRFKLSYEDQALRYWDEAKAAFITESARVEVLIGASAADIRLCGHFQLA